MRRGLVLVLLTVVAASGCFGPEGPGQAAPPETDPCQATGDAPGCAPEGPRLLLDGCEDSSLAFPLPAAAFALPAGFTAESTPATPQIVQAVYDRCATATLDGLVLDDVTLGFAGVILTAAPDRGQPDGSGIFSVEVVTDSADIARLFLDSGFAVANASATITDTAALRQVRVEGDVDYLVTAELAPAEGNMVTFEEVLHGETSWVAIRNECRYYQLAAVGQLVASSGVLLQAMPGGAPLSGFGSQAIQCAQRLDFGFAD